MNEITNNLYRFYHDFNPGDWHHLAYPLLSCFLVLLVGIVILKVIFRPVHDQIIKRPFFIYKTLFIATCVTMGSVVLSICYWWAKGIYSNGLSIQFSQLVSLILLSITGVFIHLKFRSYFKQDSIIELMKQPISEYQQTNQLNTLRKEFIKNRLWLLVPIVSFGSLFIFLLFRNKVLISIVMDDSGSMENNNAMQYGQLALTNTFESMENDYTQIVISSFQDPSSASQEFKNFEDLSEVTNAALVKANTVIANSVQEASSFIVSLTGGKGYGLNKAIWNNYLTSKQLEESNLNTSAERVMLIVSDGEEYGTDWYRPLTLCGNSDFDTFYNGQIFWIDLKDRTVIPEGSKEYIDHHGFHAMMQECYGGHIYPGFSMDDYNIALDDIMAQFELNRTLIYSAVAIVLLFSLVIFFITPPSILQ